MNCTRKVTDDIVWVGADSRRQALFEAVYSVPMGISYNSYVILDDRTALIDTADRSVTDIFFENIANALCGRSLDYLVVQHMEPDHSATLADVLNKYPECTVVCNSKTLDMIRAFNGLEPRAVIVKDGDVLDLGKHKLTFISAPMVHWPEVMVTYDSASGALFSADAFGTFGALNGALFADEVDFDRDYVDQARRYYCNIVGKYGKQVESLLKKVASFNVKMLCPLHGFVWRRDIDYYVNKYMHWATYTPEVQGVMIAYASVYGNTEKVANALACALFERGIRCVMHDVSVSEASYVIADAFKYSHLVFASVTYNGGVFVTMDNLLRDIASHGLKNRTVAFIENGSWAPLAASKMRELLPSMRVLDECITVRSSLRSEGVEAVERLASAIAETV